MRNKLTGQLTAAPRGVTAKQANPSQGPGGHISPAEAIRKAQAVAMDHVKKINAGERLPRR